MLLIVQIMAVPLATDSLEVALPGPDIGAPAPDPVRNLLVIESDGTLVWNGQRSTKAASPIDLPGFDR